MTLEARSAVIFAFSLNIVATRTDGTTATGAQDAEHSVVTQLTVGHAIVDDEAGFIEGATTRGATEAADAPVLVQCPHCVPVNFTFAFLALLGVTALVTNLTQSPVALIDEPAVLEELTALVASEALRHVSLVHR